ncbi:MAG: ATP-binding protein [Opitutales bacterium]|nr:ATP-binding protein [Opitutales bacterium]MCH8541300.1 ATP-binding protein [Opitutales bacterium]
MELFQILEYALGEIINNCCQHSYGSGFVSAQYYPRDGFVRLAIADNGIGIRESFRQSGSPHFHDKLSDRDFLEIAIEPEISSKNHIRGPYGDPVNAGVGLSIVEYLIANTYGYFFLSSGHSWVFRDGEKDREYGNFGDLSFPGVTCSLAFRRGEAYAKYCLIQEARKELGLISQKPNKQPNIFQ